MSSIWGTCQYLYSKPAQNEKLTSINTPSTADQINIPPTNTQIPQNNVKTNKPPLTTNKNVDVQISVNTMNENVYTLVEPVTLLGLKYIFPRGTLGDSNVIKSIDSSLLSMGDSCGAKVSATLEISNPKIEGTHQTLHGDATVAVDVIKVVSYGVPQKSCAY